MSEQVAPLTRREQLIVQMLRSWDLMDPAGASGVRSTDGSRVPLLSHEPHCLMHRGPARCTCWLVGMRELSRCLRLMRRTERPLWYHVHERYVAANRRPMLVQVKRNRPVVAGNIQVVGLLDNHALDKRGNGIVRVLVEVWSERADTGKALRGVSWLAREFRGEPQLPLEVMAA